MAIDDCDLAKGLKECFRDPEFIEHFRETVLAPVIRQVVSEAVALRKEALSELRSEMAAEIEKRDDKIKKLRDEVRTAKDDINELEQYSRRNCLLISGIPERENEKTDQLAIDVAKAANVALTGAEIDRSHRIGPKKKGKTRQIIVKLTSFNKRDELCQGRKDLSSGRVRNHSILTTAVLSRIFISENLTQQNQKTLYVARQLKRKGTIARAWTDNCRMKIRVKEGSPTKIIRSLADLYKIAGDDPDVLAALREDGASSAPADVTGSAPSAARAGAAAVAASAGRGAAQVEDGELPRVTRAQKESRLGRGSASRPASAQSASDAAKS